jgi:FemAB-related protein (PEP-CTERM system-associated)
VTYPCAAEPVGVRSSAAIIRQVSPADPYFPPIAGQERGATLAHAPEWYAVIRRAYGHDPLYYAGEDAQGQRGLLPAFVVRRPLFGTVVTSMPFLDGGGPMTSSPVLAGQLLDHLIAAAGRLGARDVEIRCTTRLAVPVQPAQHKVLLVLDLPADPDRMWRQLDKDVRNQVRRAERCGLSVVAGRIEHVSDFYSVLAARMRDLGSPLHAFAFIRAAAEAFGDRARIVLVRRGATTVGGLMAIAFGDALVVPWAACLKEYFPLRPNMLLYWETIRFACAEGFRRFDFGRSTIRSGTYYFKRQWGAEEQPLFWYTIPVRACARPPGTLPGASDAIARLWRRLPIAVTRRLGPPIRKYLTE